MESILTQGKTYSIRRATYENRPHIIVPVVMMVEGVHAGSHGPILHTAQELGKVVAAWNGIPVTILHPTDTNGINISANSPTVQSVGRIFNSRMEGVKLKAEAWLDEQKLLAISPTASAYISQGRPLDVSIGVFTEDQPVQGEWQGETYIAVATNHRPDHLALLPGEQGACSWADGCGVRVNSDKSNFKVYEKMTKTELQTLKQTIINNLIQTNRVSLKGRIETLSRKVDQMDVYDESNERFSEMHMLEDVYEDYIIYRKRTRGQDQEMYYKQDYQINADDTVEFVNEPVKVRKDVNYVQVNTRRTIFNNNPKFETMSKPSACLVAKVDSLITNSATKFTDEDRDWLLTQSEAVLDKMTPAETTPETPPQINAEVVRNYVRETFQNTDEFVNLLPGEMKDQMQAALRLHSQQREKMINHIVTNSEKDLWPVEELKAMSAAMLEKVFKTIPAKPADPGTPPADYSGNGGTPPVEKETGIAPMFPTGYGVEKK